LAYETTTSSVSHMLVYNSILKGVPFDFVFLFGKQLGYLWKVCRLLHKGRVINKLQNLLNDVILSFSEYEISEIYV